MVKKERKTFLFEDPTKSVPRGDTTVVLRNREEAYLAALHKELRENPEKREAIEAEIAKITGHNVSSTIERAVSKTRTQRAVKDSDFPEE